MDGATPKVTGDNEPREEITSIRGSGPIITLPPSPKYRAYYVLEDQLKLISDAGSSVHLSFASISVGIFFTVMMTLMTIDIFPQHPRFFVVSVVLSVVSGFTAIFLGILWYRNRKRAYAVLQELRSQYPEPPAS
jgi:hypothetical protein